MIEHVGLAHTEAELAALIDIGWHRIAPDQLTLELTPTPPAVPGLPRASVPQSALTRWWSPSARPRCETFCTGHIPAWGCVRRSRVIGPSSRWFWRV